MPTLPGNLYTCTVASIARLEVCTAENTKICEFSEVLGKTLHVPELTPATQLWLLLLLPLLTPTGYTALPVGDGRCGGEGRL